MWKNLRALMAILWTHGKEHKHEVQEKSIDIPTLRRKLAEAEQKILGAIAQSNLWMKKSAILQDKLSASLGHVKVLENVLVESNRTIDALNLALELREKEENEGLQNYIDELETEMDEAVELIQKYGLELRKA